MPREPAQVLGHLVQAAQGQQHPRMRRPQPLEPAQRLRGAPLRDVVQDQASEQRLVLAGGRARGELRQEQPRQDPGGIGVSALRQVDPCAHRPVQRPDTEGPVRSRN
ncbi:hypothetical protein ABZY93_26155 [Streptomyces smyrnaeus]|uniref:hypothetical protein n=1 Tax=Streptomyces smyrnaeus TaxID=1387713 RepID=UPI0033BBC8EF